MLDLRFFREGNPKVYRMQLDTPIKTPDPPNDTLKQVCFDISWHPKNFLGRLSFSIRKPYGIKPNPADNTTRPRLDSTVGISRMAPCNSPPVMSSVRIYTYGSWIKWRFGLGRWKWEISGSGKASYESYVIVFVHVKFLGRYWLEKTFLKERFESFQSWRVFCYFQFCVFVAFQ